MLVPVTYQSVIQFKGKACLSNMKTSQKEINRFILTLVLWGLVQVICGLSILVTVMGYWRHILFPLNEPIFVFVAVPIFINAGTCIIAFAFVRGKILRIAVFVTSVISLIFSVSMSFLLIISHHGHTQSYNRDEDSTSETVYLFQLAMGMVIAFGNSFTATFFSLFLPRCCCTSTPGLVHLQLLYFDGMDHFDGKDHFDGVDHFEEETEKPLPLPYNHEPPLETMTFVKYQDLTLYTSSSGRLETQQVGAELPPVYTSTDWTCYQTSDLDKCYQASAPDYV